MWTVPALEALFCGARPILYDLPSFRWYKGHAVFLNASIRGDELSDAIVEALQNPAEPVTADELTTLHATFSWQTIVPALFDRVADRINGGV